MFRADGFSLFVNVEATPGDNMAPVLGIDLPRDTLQSTRQQGIVGVEETVNVTRGALETLINSVGLTSIRLADHMQMGVASQHFWSLVAGHSIDDDMLKTR